MIKFTRNFNEFGFISRLKYVYRPNYGWDMDIVKHEYISINNDNNKITSYGYLIDEPYSIGFICQ